MNCDWPNHELDLAIWRATQRVSRPVVCQTARGAGGYVPRLRKRWGRTGHGMGIESNE